MASEAACLTELRYATNDWLRGPEVAVILQQKDHVPKSLFPAIFLYNPIADVPQPGSRVLSFNLDRLVAPSVVNHRDSRMHLLKGSQPLRATNLKGLRESDKGVTRECENRVIYRTKNWNGSEFWIAPGLCHKEILYFRCGQVFNFCCYDFCCAIGSCVRSLVRQAH